MKVGVITHCGTKDNYGQVLQAYALQRAIVKCGHEPYLIRYIYQEPSLVKMKNIKKLFNPAKVFRSARRYFTVTMTAAINKAHNRHFDRFIQDNIKVTALQYNDYSFPLQKNPPAADVYISGSDQVFSGSPPHLSYFLDFGNKNVRRLAYAASFGQNYALPPEHYPILREALKNFSWLSLREEDGLELCHRLGRKDAVLMPDPTLLLTAEDYQKIASPRCCQRVKHPGRKKCFLYILGNKTKIPWKKMRNYLNENDYDLTYVASQGQIDFYRKTYPGIEEWLYQISHADLVITNSFHGTIFAILFNRPFLVFPLEGNDTRIKTLFSLLKINQKHIFRQDFEDDLTDDYKSINHLIEKTRSSALSALCRNLASDKNCINLPSLDRIQAKQATK